MKNKIVQNALTRKIFTKIFITIATYSAAIMIIFIVGKTYLGRNIWFKNDPLYPILHFLNKYQDSIISLLLIIGLIIIFSYYLLKSLKYMDCLIDASNELINDETEHISLPEELYDVEKRLNHMKQTARKNANIAIDNEQRKNDLIVYLAHDLKTPLTSIIGYLSLLTDEKEISKKTQQRYLGITLDKAYRLENLINELFDIARYNSENVILEQEELNFNLMIEQITEEFYSMLKAQNKKISFNSNETIFYLGDSNKLARVINNLIKNAINYSLNKSIINIDLKKEQKYIIIEIKNKSKNIPQNNLNKIFDKFYRMDISRTSEAGGSGLGLAIAKDIIELYNGTISVSNNNNIIIFRIKLPIN